MKPLDYAANDDYTELIERYKKYPTETATLYKLGSYYLAHKDYELAIQRLQGAVGDPFLRLPALKMLAEAYEANGMAKEASDARDRLVRELGGDPER